MPKHLILVKHSLPEVVESLPAHQWKLCSEGRERAERLAHQLRRFQPEVIFSSNEPKARETAEIIVKVHKLNLQTLENLHEHDRRNVPYLSQDEFQASVREFFQKPDVLVFGNETANQCYARFSKAVYSILKLHADETPIIVAHGTVISLFVSRVVGIPPHLLWEELGLPSFVVTDLELRTLVAKENNF